MSIDVRHREVWANQIKAFTDFFSDGATVDGGQILRELVVTSVSSAHDELSSLILGRPALAGRHRAYAIFHTASVRRCAGQLVICQASTVTRRVAIQPSPVAVRLLCSTREAVNHDLVLILHTSHKRLSFIFQSPLTLMLLLHFTPGFMPCPRCQRS